MMDYPIAEGTPPVDAEEKAERKQEREEEKRKSAMRDALYALNQVQQLSLVDDEYVSDPKFIGVLTQVRDQVDAVITRSSAPPRAEEVIPGEGVEPATKDTGGRLKEGQGRNLARQLGFGTGPA